MLHRGDANGLAVQRLALDGKRNAAAFGRALGLIAITFHCQGKHRDCTARISPLLSRFAPVQRLVHQRQTFVYRCHGRKRPRPLKAGAVDRTARSRIRPFPLCIIALSRNASCLHLSFNYSQSAFFKQGPPSRYPLDQGVHGLAHEHDALLESNKLNRGSPWTATSRSNRRSRVLMVGRPSAPSLDSSTRLSLALRRRSVGSLSCCRRRRHWSVSHVWLTPRRRAMAGHVSGSSH